MVCVSAETEKQGDVFTVLGDVGGIRSLLARPGSELALAARDLWSCQLRWLDESRDSLQTRDTMTLDSRRWRKNVISVTRFLRQCSNFGTVAEQVLSARLPSARTSVARKSLQTKDRPSRSTIQRHHLCTWHSSVGGGSVTPHERVGIVLF